MKVITPYIELGVDKITPDPNQPRKYFDEDKIKSIATTINSNISDGKTGIINPLEIDQNYMIVTGENRWRAAKLAGLKTVPVKVIELDADERYWRQGIENLGRKNMTHVEISNWMVSVLKRMGWQDRRDFEPGSKSGVWDSNLGQGYVNTLAEKLGITYRSIYDHLVLQHETSEIKDFLKDNDSAYSMIREINKARVDSETKEILKKKVLDHTLVDRETTNALLDEVRLRPEKREKLLEGDYRSGARQNIHTIKTIGEEVEPEAQNIRMGQDLVRAMVDLKGILNLANLKKIAEIDKERTIDMAKKIIAELEHIVDELEN